MEKSIYSEEYGVMLGLLQDARRAAQITQAELAKKLGQSQSFVSKYERGERRIDVIQLRTICNVMGTTLPEFVTKLEKALSSPKRQRRG